ncbi:MAG: 50S ribosomal protein L4 [Candidatus Margulisiibacteriota bacterium]
MVSLPLFDKNGKSSGAIEAKDSVFSIPVKESVVHSVFVSQRAGARQGTASSKTRGEVRGGGKKPWKQKGTGRARAGSSRSPLWRGGGVMFGPKPRDYSKPMPKKVRLLALNMAIADKVKSNEVKVVEDFSLAGSKTKLFMEIVRNLGLDSAIMALDGAGAAEKKAAANIEKIKVVSSKNLSVFDILRYGTLVLDKSAVLNLEERFQTKE